ncbi:hypothetical protein HKX48_003794 [Thoreauomyces humboldtii]|nr:hypothetical protein HKX48_003794 [Thoreauomyces humboldtii]
MNPRRKIFVVLVPGHAAGSDVGSSPLAIYIGECMEALGTDSEHFVKHFSGVERITTLGELVKNSHLRVPKLQKGSMASRGNWLTRGAVVVVVDDVATSGSSLKAVEELCLEEGAGMVYPFSLTCTFSG